MKAEQHGDLVTLAMTEREAWDFYIALDHARGEIERAIKTFPEADFLVGHGLKPIDNVNEAFKDVLEDFLKD